MQTLHTEDSTEENPNTPLVLDVGKHSLLSATSLLSLSPAKHGSARKLSNSILVKAFPCITEKYRERYFILIGNYLFRFISKTSDKPKGLPIPIDTITTTKIDNITFELAMIRKIYIIQVFTSNECDEWIEAIQQRKNESIREKMGHKKYKYSEIEQINKIADRMFNRKVNQESLETGGSNDISSGFMMS